MEEKPKFYRILLDEALNEKINRMIQELKGESKYIKINSSKLSGWIINQFYENGFKRNKNKIVSDHFQSKEYFKNVLNRLDDVIDPEEALKLMQSKLKELHTKPSTKARSEVA